MTVKEELSLGIIGGADGPTVLFVTGRFPWEIVILGLLCIVAVIWYFKRKK